MSAPGAISAESLSQGLPTYQFLSYRGMGDLELAMQAIAKRLPADVNLVAGVPRSGLLAASVLALQTNLSLTDVDGLLTTPRRLLGSGKRPLRNTEPGLSHGRVVVVDDSVGSGQQMRAIKARLRDAGLEDQVIYAAAFVTTPNRDLVDVFAEVVDQPRIFAWNLMHHPDLLARTCFDIDGVLCPDPAYETNDDGPRYADFLSSAAALFVPSSPVGYVVTSRLEKYRSQTEEWLAQHSIRYQRLVMLADISAEQRKTSGAHATHKARFYAQSDAELFIESEYGQAVDIAHISGKQVFAMDRRAMVYPSIGRAAVKSAGPLLRSCASVPPAQVAYWALRRQTPRALKRAVDALRRATA